MTTGYRVRLDLNLDAADRLVDGAASDGLMAVALDGEAFAKHNMTGGRSAPGDFPGVDTGTLRAGIHASPTDDPLCKRLDSSADYSIYLEFGTVKSLPKGMEGPRQGHMAARPFMRPTMRHMQEDGPEIAAAAMKRRLK